MCTYVSIYVYMCVYMCIYICVYIYTCIYTYVCGCMCIYIYIYVGPQKTTEKPQAQNHPITYIEYHGIARAVENSAPGTAHLCLENQSQVVKEQAGLRGQGW